ncbi:MAG: hypothetical protein OEW77_08045 [Gemmatimonadota bacterium]|nr:hypothetical protein [Gemmatimonadota bacterium]
MPSLLAAALLWGAVAAALAGQVMILRSSRRVIGRTPGARRPIEWLFAIGPAVVLVVVLILTWHAATRPPVLRMDVLPVAGELRS